MKLYYNQALKKLEDKNNILVRFNYYNSIIRNLDGEELGNISEKITDKLVDSGKLIFIGDGTDLLDHEKYYKLA